MSRHKTQTNKICRVCLSLVDDFTDINTVEESTGFMPYRDKLALVVPEMMLDMIQSPVICVQCSGELKLAYHFKQKCMQTEQKIRQLVQGCGGVIYSLDLNNLADRSKAKLKDPPPLAPIKQKQANVVTFPPAVILKLDQRPAPKKAEVIDEIPPKVTEQKEIEFHAVDEDKSEAEESLLVPKHEEPIEINDDPLFNPGASPPVTKALTTEAHLLRVSEISCNFCGQTFVGMFSLRNHQRMCMGAIAHTAEIKKESEKFVPILPAPPTGLKRKRKHVSLLVAAAKPEKPKKAGSRVTLPAKAKNILQRWLFQHRDNPYPTDVDKLELINQTDLTLVQVENWFINARRRILQKMLTKGNKYERKVLRAQEDSSDSDWTV